jgi:hypothetical protein
MSEPDDSLDRVLQGFSSWAASTPEPEETDTDPEVRKRRRALEAADASNRISGLVRPAATDHLFQAWVRCELTDDQLRRKLQEFYQEGRVGSGSLCE